MNFTQNRFRIGPIFKANVPVINYEQLKRNNNIYNMSFRKQHLTLCKNSKKGRLFIKIPEKSIHFKVIAKNRITLYNAQKQQFRIQCQKELYSNSLFITSRATDCSFLWCDNKNGYKKKDGLSKPARHPIKLKTTLELKPQRYHRILSESFQGWA